MTLWKWSQTAASNSNSDSTINWAEGQAPSSVNNSARAEMAAVAKYRDDLAGVQPSNVVITSDGSATAYTVSTNQILTTLTNGFAITFRAHASNTGTATLNVDSLGAKPLRMKTATEIVADDILIGHTYTATYYQPGDEWLLRVSPIPADSVDGSKIPDDSIDSEHYVDGSIDTAHIADDQVTFPKIQNITTARILGRTTASDGDIEQLTASADLTLTGGTLGIVNPAKLVFIETQTASSSSALNFTTLSATYHSFFFRLIDIRPATDDDTLVARVSVSGVFQSTGYLNTIIYHSASGAFGQSTNGILLSSDDGAGTNVGSAAGDARWNGTLWVSPHGSARTGISGQGFYGNAAGNPTGVSFYGYYDTAGAVDGIRFLFLGGNITSGSIHMYGLKV